MQAIPKIQCSVCKEIMSPDMWETHLIVSAPVIEIYNTWVAEALSYVGIPMTGRVLGYQESVVAEGFPLVIESILYDRDVCNLKQVPITVVFNRAVPVLKYGYDTEVVWTHTTKLSCIQLSKDNVITFSNYDYSDFNVEIIEELVL